MPKLNFEPNQLSDNTEIADLKYRYSLGKAISLRIERPIDPGLRQEDDTGVTILCPGWVELGKSLSPLRNTMAEMGHTAVTIHHPQPRWYRPDQAFLTARTDRIKGIQEVFKYLGEVLIDSEEISTLGHSMGGSDQTRAFVDFPYVPRVMTYAATAGTNPNAKFYSVAYGISNEVRINELPRKVNRQDHHVGDDVFWGVVGYAAQNPNSAFAQGRDAAVKYVGEHIGRLASRGALLGDITGDLDKVFPVEQEQEYKGSLPYDVRLHLIGPNSTHNFTTYMPDEVARFHLDTIVRRAELLEARNEVEQRIIDQQILGRAS